MPEPERKYPHCKHCRGDAGGPLHQVPCALCPVPLVTGSEPPTDKPLKFTFPDFNEDAYKMAVDVQSLVDKVVSIQEKVIRAAVIASLRRAGYVIIEPENARTSDVRSLANSQARDCYPGGKLEARQDKRRAFVEGALFEHYRHLR